MFLVTPDLLEILRMTPKNERFAGAARGFRDLPVYRVMVRNHAAEADECIGQFTSQVTANAKAQAVSTLGNTAWVVAR
jgi:hypothetical protein